MFNPNNPEEVKKVIERLVEHGLLRSANLEGANLRYANLSYARLTDANLEGAAIIPSQLKGFRIISE